MRGAIRWRFSGRYTFTRFLDEAYLFDRAAIGEPQQLILDGDITDVLHLLWLAPRSVDELCSIVSSIRGRALQRGEAERALAILRDMQVVQQVAAFEHIPPHQLRYPRDLSGAELVDHVRASGQLPYYYSPPTANLFVNGTCNQHCAFCFLDFELMKKEQSACLSLEEWLRVVDECASAGIGTINIGGMEPLVTLDLTKAILKHGALLGLEVGFITNGTIPLSDEDIEFFASNRVSIGVSLQSHLPTVHNQLAAHPTAHQRVISNLAKLVAAGVTVGIQSVALRDNTEHIEDFVRWLDVLGVRTFNLQNVFGGPWCDHVPFFDVALTPLEYQQVRKRVDAVSTRNLVTKSEPFPNEQGYSPESTSSMRKGRVIRHYSRCSAGKTSIHISPTGDAYPCPFTVAVKEHRLGNVLKDGLLAIWHDTSAFGEFRRFARSDYSSPACTSCSAFQVCRGGCLITAKAVSGSYTGGDPRCWAVAETSVGRAT